MTFFCNKCGYSGLVQVGHPMNAANGMPCPYYAVELPDLSEAERKKIEMDFGLSRTALPPAVDDSQDSGATK